MANRGDLEALGPTRMLLCEVVLWSEVLHSAGELRGHGSTRMVSYAVVLVSEVLDGEVCGVGRLLIYLYMLLNEQMTMGKRNLSSNYHGDLFNSSLGLKHSQKEDMGVIQIYGRGGRGTSSIIFSSLGMVGSASSEWNLSRCNCLFDPLEHFRGCDY